MQESLSTGLESWATPVIYLAGIATTLATGISVGRFKASPHADLPAGKAAAAFLILAAAIITTGIALLAATLMEPKSNHISQALLMLAVGAGPQILIILINFKSETHGQINTEPDEKPKPKHH